MASKRGKGSRKSSKKSPGLTIESHTNLHFEVDAEKIAAIKRCLEKGTLTITLSKVNLASAGRVAGAYIYD